MKQKYIDTNTTTVADNTLLISNKLYANSSKEEGLLVSNSNDELSIFIFVYVIPAKILNDIVIVSSAKNNPMMRETFTSAIPSSSNIAVMVIYVSHVYVSSNNII